MCMQNRKNVTTACSSLYQVETHVGVGHRKGDAGLLGGWVELEAGHPGGQGLGGLSRLHGELRDAQLSSKYFGDLVHCCYRNILLRAHYSTGGT
jgi:hypothetical protein